MSILSKSYFHNEADAFAHLESLIWGNKPVCPHCGNTEKKIYVLKGVRSKPSKKNPDGVERHGLKKCGACRKQFTVRVGTVFESSHVPLHKWLQAAYLMMSSKKGISSKQMERTLEVTYKTAWFMTHRLREAMMQSNLPPLGGEGAIVEADETYVGNKVSAKRKKILKRKGVRGWGGSNNKFTVVSLVERGGSVRSFNIERATKSSVGEIVAKNVDRRSRLMTDESRLYDQIGSQYATHETVIHSRGEYVRGDVYTNTLEGYYSIFKRGMKGVYQHCKQKHLHRYLAEFDFRYNYREANGSNDMERTEAALQGIVGKRLTYRQPDEKTM
jgi:transposase-like protein